MNKECDRLKEELNSRDVKLKWSQTKLKSEMDALKETREKLEAAQVQVVCNRIIRIDL